MIKKLDLYVLKNFIMVLFMTFFICLFYVPCHAETAGLFAKYSQRPGLAFVSDNAYIRPISGKGMGFANGKIP